MCSALKRPIFHAVGLVLQNDAIIAKSRPLFGDYVKQSAGGIQAARDLDVLRLERLITPLAQNDAAIERDLSDPVFPAQAKSADDRQLLAMRARLVQVLNEQQRALNLIGGFTDTQQMGELQHEGNSQMDRATGAETRQAPPPATPTPAPDDLLDTGAGANDIARRNDPRYTQTNSLEGYNPLNAFDAQMAADQRQIATGEAAASKTIDPIVQECKRP